jgi:hypothetical protein
MIVIDDILVSDLVIENQFVCDLNKCKGACCIEGDGGAPLEKEELKILDDIYDIIEPYMSEQGKQAVAEKGRYVEEADDEYTGFGTPLIGNTGACAYVTYDEKGITKCTIEQAFLEGKIDFKKPISCHLYPIRVKEYKTVTAVNYEVWDICSPACTLGAQLKVPTYQFVKEALVRKFGEEFYVQLEGAAQFKNKNSKE